MVLTDSHNDSDQAITLFTMMNIMTVMKMKMLMMMMMKVGDDDGYPVMKVI